ncbi:MAG: glycosyltransferase [Bacteroidia bacterium]|nr:glycosyltransferase [Bacteroidia bacterium]
MLISIIIPSYNKVNYIKQTLESIRTQSYANWECIIVDDASTDGTKEILTEYSSDKRFRVFIEEVNRGANFCRNKGITLAQGDWVIFMDADDNLHPECLEKRINAINKNPGYDFYVFPLAAFEREVNNIKSVWIPNKKKALERFLAHNLPWQTMQPIWNKKFLLENDLRYDENLHKLQDVDFHIHALLKTDNFFVESAIPADCFFRIDSQRIDKPVWYMERYINAYLVFYNKYSKVLTSATLRKYLNRSLLIIYLYFLKFAADNNSIDFFRDNIKNLLLKEVTNKFLKTIMEFYYQVIKRGVYFPGSITILRGIGFICGFSR